MTSGSALLSRAMIKLFSGCPGAMGAPLRRVAFASASTSRRNPAFRFFSSGPWQAKQFAERIGRTSRPKRTGSAAEKTTVTIEAAGAARSSDTLSQRCQEADCLDFISFEVWPRLALRRRRPWGFVHQPGPAPGTSGSLQVGPTYAETGSDETAGLPKIRS